MILADILIFQAMAGLPFSLACSEAAQHDGGHMAAFLTPGMEKGERDMG